MADAPLVLFLAGDVMTGRGVDQILQHPSAPSLREPFVDDAREYVRLAEETSGPVPRGVGPEYVWGEAIAEWERVAPAARIVNLETAITGSDEYWRGKDIHYRMHPGNIGCLRAARFDVCVLANNHVLDYGREGLVETLDTLEDAGIGTAGAGRTLEEARRPAMLPAPGGSRVFVTACGHVSSGIPDDWIARAGRPGVDLLPDLSDEAAAALAARATADKQAGDVAVVSLHWGGNWGYHVPRSHVEFAHRLIDGGVDLVHGHSSHHVRPIEIYRGKLILYGCGDFVDDYEGIAGYGEYRDDLVLMFFPSLHPRTGRLLALRMTPMQIRRLSLTRATAEDARWLCDTLKRTSIAPGASPRVAADGALVLEPPAVT